MDLTLTDDQELLAATAADFLAARSPSSHVREMDAHPAGYSAAQWEEMAHLGWMGMAIPPEHDGAGAGFLELCLVVEQMGTVLLPGPFVSTVAVCATAIARHGSEKQRSALLAPVARGECILSFARAEPGAGWDGSGSSVTVREEGSGFVLDGTAMFVPYADVADRLLVVAQHAAGDGDELTAYLVPGGADGLTTTALDTVGLERSHRIELAGVSVPADAVLGAPGRGIEVAETATRHGAAATCALMVGGARRVLDMTVAYAGDRQQFDTPIGTFQAVQHHCADMGVDVLTGRLLAFEAIWRLSEGLDADEEVSMAKAWVGEAYRRVCALGHQIHGAIGFTREHDIHLYLRHAIGTDLAFGDADHHWGRVADLIGLPRPCP